MKLTLEKRMIVEREFVKKQEDIIVGKNDEGSTFFIQDENANDVTFYLENIDAVIELLQILKETPML